MKKYISFTPFSQYPPASQPSYAPGLRSSGLIVTEGVSGNQKGLWISGPLYGPNDQDWWRSQCGHTVDFEMEQCPACGEAKPSSQPHQPHQQMGAISQMGAVPQAGASQ